MTAFATTNWFSVIVGHTHATPDRRGDAWITCPNCGDKRKKFSFSERGANCFVCGFRPSLRQLAELLGIRGDLVYTAPVIPAIERKPRPWQLKAGIILRDLGATPGLEQAWQKYKPLSKKTIHEALLGYGVFPGGLAFQDGSEWKRCNHRRLIVPIFATEGGKPNLIGFRCRAVECDCPKWLSPGGSHLSLYGIEDVKPASDVLVICENPIDALLVRQEWEGGAVATLGVSIWGDGYTEAVAATAPQQIVTWFDNDAPGQTTNPAIIAAWHARHPRVDPPLRGIKLTNRLLQAGLPATFYRWPNTADAGADIGGFFK